jgi:hypothetical protein
MYVEISDKPHKFDTSSIGDIAKYHLQVPSTSQKISTISQVGDTKGDDGEVYQNGGPNGNVPAQLTHFPVKMYYISTS